MLTAAVIMNCINVGFTLSLLKVDPAKALLLISLNPLWSAILGVVILGDVLPTRTIIAQALSLASMVLVFVPNVLDALSGDVVEAEVGETAPAEENPLMILIPVATGILQAIFLIFVRFTSKRSKGVSFEAVPAAAAFLSSALAAYMSGGESLTDGIAPMFWLFLSFNGLGLALYNTACVVAPRFITGAEVALILLLEVVGGPIWVFFIYGDVPSPWTLASGGLLVSALVGHEIAGMNAKEELAESSSKVSSERSSMETVRTSFVDKRLLTSGDTQETDTHYQKMVV